MSRSTFSAVDVLGHGGHGHVAVAEQRDASPAAFTSALLPNGLEDHAAGVLAGSKASPSISTSRTGRLQAVEEHRQVLQQHAADAAQADHLDAALVRQLADESYVGWVSGLGHS